ncbi:UNVERIFIED_CONTAM: hypothetical protein K2H54_000260 [Gekko kuhli]
MATASTSGVQWANTNGGGTQFTNTGLPIGSVAIAAKDYKDNGTTTGLASLAKEFNGMAAGFYHGNWAALVTALSTNSKSDILSTPSIVTMDNKECLLQRRPGSAGAERLPELHHQRSGVQHHRTPRRCFSNKYTQFRSEQQVAAAQEGYLTSPKRQVLPEYSQGVTTSPEAQKQIEQMKQHQQTTIDSVQPFLCRQGVTPQTLLEVRRVAGCAFTVEQMDGEAFEELLMAHYQRGLLRGAPADVRISASRLDFFALAEELPQSEDLLDADDDAPIIRLINAMLSEAIKEEASDIHIETFERALVIRFRHRWCAAGDPAAHRKLASLLVSRIKRIGGRAVDVRVSTMPSSYGERVVLRLLDKNNVRLELKLLGMTLANRNIISELIRKPHASFWGGQTQVNSKVDMTFARGLRAILRQDPDVVMVGEIRDLETAQIAVQASLTGHLVMSTLHTNTAIGVAAGGLRAVQPHRYRGRTGIHELVVNSTKRWREAIHSASGELAIERLIRGHTPSIRRDGIDKVLKGQTSLEEVLRVTRKTEMAAFEYKALDGKGRNKSGVLEGDSARQVRQLLREQGLTPLEVNETTEKAKREANRFVLFRRGASTAELAMITRQLATLVVAQFEHMGQQLPATTRFLIGTSELMQHYGLWFLLLLLVGGFVWRWWLTDDKRRRHWHQLILRLPVIGRVSRGLNTARFARTQSILNASAVPLLEGMKISGEVLSNDFARMRIGEATERVREGTSLRKSLDETKIFPPMMLHMIASGEQSGELDNMLERAADNQDRSSKPW